MGVIAFGPVTFTSVTSKFGESPMAFVLRRILVEKPPREQPSAC